MKIRHLLLAAISIFAVTACGGGGKSSAEVDSKQDANNIIEYTNGVIDYMNDVGSWFRSNESAIEKAVAGPRNNRKMDFFVMTPFMEFSHKTENLTKATTSLSAEEQEYFNTNMADFMERFKNMRGCVDELKKYCENEDFKDDKYAQGKVLADSIENNYEKLLEMRSEIFDKIDEVTEVAERIILEDHPLRDPIFALKDELANFDSLYNAFSDYSDKTVGIEKVDAAYTAFEAGINQHKDMYKDILKDGTDQTDYDRFYKECDEALGVFRKVLRNAKEGKKVTDDDFDDFSRERRDLISRYNSFND